MSILLLIKNLFPELLQQLSKCLKPFKAAIHPKCYTTETLPPCVRVRQRSVENILPSNDDTDDVDADEDAEDEAGKDDDCGGVGPSAIGGCECITLKMAGWTL